MSKNFFEDKEFMKLSTETLTKGLKGKISDSSIEKLKNFSQNSSIFHKEAVADTWTLAIYGYVKVVTTSDDSTFKGNHWGIGLGAVTAYGTIQYENWEDLKKDTRNYFIQAYAEGGGAIQVVFFDKDGDPLGQFIGACAGISIFAAGGDGKWIGY